MRIPVGFFANWFKEHGRSFPWRGEEVSPYGILLAEVLLKQTRAEMVATVWPSLLRRYPSPADLASANPENLFQHIACLGFGCQRTAALLRLSAALDGAGETTLTARGPDGVAPRRYICCSCNRLLCVWPSSTGCGS